MTTETFAGSNLAAILNALTGEMGIENVIGTEEDARLGAPPSVTWVPGDAEYSDVAQQRDDLHLRAVHEVAPHFVVNLWGTTYFECEDLEERLELALYTLFSPNGYTLKGKRKTSGGNKPDGGGRSFVFEVPVQLLRIPLPVERYTSVALTSATGAGTVNEEAAEIPGAVS